GGTRVDRRGGRGLSVQRAGLDLESVTASPIQPPQPMMDTAPGPAAPRDRWYVLAVLTVVYALNIADRFSISTLIEPIRQELRLSDSGIAFLTGVALALFYVTVGIPIAALADRMSRRDILTLALAIWSGMTALCGLAQNYWQLLLARFGVGIGEAGGTPPSTSMLADKFPPARRPMANTIFALGACLGAWLGSQVAGAVAERSGWRAAFLVLGIPGVLVALLVWLTVREPRRGQLDASAGGRRPSTLAATLRFIATQRSAIHLLLGGSVATFWSWGLMWWTPTFLQRSHHMTVGEAGQLLGPMHLIAGTAGTLLAAWLMARRAAADPRYVTRLLGWVTALTTDRKSTRLNSSHRTISYAVFCLKKKTHTTGPHKFEFLRDLRVGFRMIWAVIRAPDFWPGCGCGAYSSDVLLGVCTGLLMITVRR